MTVPKNALVKQYTKLFEMDDIEFSITPSAIDYIVEKAFEFKIGARGLRTLCETILNDAMFNLPSSDTKELKITKFMLIRNFKYRYISSESCLINPKVLQHIL